MNKKPLKIIVVTFIIMVITFFVFGSLFYLFLLLPPVQQKAVNVVSEELNKIIVGNITVGKVKSNLFSRIDLVDVRISDKEDSDVFVLISTLRVRYYLPALLKKQLRITSVQSEQFEANLRVTKKGVYKIPFMPRPDFKLGHSSSSDWSVKIGTVRLKELNATYNDSLLEMYGAVNSARCLIRFPRLDSVVISSKIPDGYYYSKWWHGTIDSLETQVSINKNSINIFKIFTAGSSTILNGYGKIPLNYKDNWDLHVDVSSNILPIYALKTYVPEFGDQGHIQLKADWTGTFKKPLYSLRLSGQEIFYNDFKIDSIFVNGRTDLKECIHLNVSAKSEIADIDLNGKVNINHLNSFHPVIDKYSFDSRLQNIRLGKIGSRIDQIKKIPGDTATMKIHVNGKGYKDLPKAAQVELSIQESSDDSLLISLGLKDHSWEINSFWANNQLEGHGSIQKNGAVKGTVSGDITNLYTLSRYFCKEKVDGRLSFNASIDGRVNSPIIKAEIGSNNLKWHSVRIDTLSSVISVNKDVFLEKMFCSARANLDSVSRYLFKKDDIKGDLKIKLKASGALTNPDMNFQLDGQRIGYKIDVADRCSGMFSLKGFDSLKFQNFTLSKGKSEIVADGDLIIGDYLKKRSALGANMKIKGGYSKNGSAVDAGTIEVNGSLGTDSIDALVLSKDFNIAVFHEWLPTLRSVEGVISLESSVEGSLKNPQGSLVIDAEKVGYNRIGVKSIRSQITLQDSLLKFDSTFLIIDSVSRIFTSGILPLRPGSGWKVDDDHNRNGMVHVQSENFDLGLISKFLGPGWSVHGSSYLLLNMDLSNDGWRLGGIANLQNSSFSNEQINFSAAAIDMNSKISGTLMNPQVAYSINTGKIAAASLKIDSTKIKGSIEKDKFHINNGSIYLSNGGLAEINGETPIDIVHGVFTGESTKLDFKVSRLGLSELNAFTGNEMIRGGVINGYGILSFKNKRPIVNGKISLEKGKLAIDGVEPQVGPLDAEFILNSDTVLVSKCKGKWGSGSLDVIGFLVWSPDSIKDVAISGKLKNASIELPDIATSRIQDFRFSFSRRKSDFLLSGTVDLGATRLIRDIRLADLFDQINSSNELEKDENSFLKNVNLQIKVNCIENPLLDINLGYMEIATDISITGNALSPTFVGELSVIDGYVLYLDRQFTISKGEISNYDQYTFNPSIVIKAKTDVFYTAADSSAVTDTMILDIYGNLKKIEFKLSSYSGSLTEADIISILTFGQKLGAVGGDLKQRIRAFAGQSLMGLGTRKLEQFLDIDRIDFSGDLFNMNSQNSPTVKVTKRISPKLIVSYETAIANLSRRKISAFYRLTKYFYLRGNTESKGESGIDLIFKISK